VPRPSRGWVAIHVPRRINRANLIDVLADAMIRHGISEYDVLRDERTPLEWMALVACHREFRYWDSDGWI
jgi:hypothetical protein